jgi:hypothetical protein
VADKRVQSKKPKKWPMAYTFPSRWCDDDHLVQEARWSTMTASKSHLGPAGPQQVVVGPYLPAVTDRLVQLRCGAGGCGNIIGAVYRAVAKPLWQGRPFTWASLQHVVDASARPKEVEPWRLVLDDYSVEMLMRAECPAHGWRALPVTEAQAALPAAERRAAERDKSLTVMMRNAP